MRMTLLPPAATVLLSDATHPGPGTTTGRRQRTDARLQLAPYRRFAGTASRRTDHLAIEPPPRRRQTVPAPGGPDRRHDADVVPAGRPPVAPGGLVHLEVDQRPRLLGRRHRGHLAGRIEVTGVKAATAEDHSARIDLDLSFHPPGKPAVLTERRSDASARRNRTAVITSTGKARSPPAIKTRCSIARRSPASRVASDTAATPGYRSAWQSTPAVGTSSTARASRRPRPMGPTPAGCWSRARHRPAARPQWPSSTIRTTCVILRHGTSPRACPTSARPCCSTSRIRSRRREPHAAVSHPDPIRRDRLAASGEAVAGVENGDWLRAAADAKPAEKRCRLGACPLFPRGPSVAARKRGQAPSATRITTAIPVVDGASPHFRAPAFTV